jgi:hypothetical protein
MKIQMTRGCIANSLTVDGKEEIDLSDNERQEISYICCKNTHFYSQYHHDLYFFTF